MKIDVTIGVTRIFDEEGHTCAGGSRDGLAWATCPLVREDFCKAVN